MGALLCLFVLQVWITAVQPAGNAAGNNPGFSIQEPSGNSEPEKIQEPTGGAGREAWWDSGWRLRTTVNRPVPYRSDAPRPVEIAVDFPLLVDHSGMGGAFDPNSLRVVARNGNQPGRTVPCVYRTEYDARQGCDRSYLTWISEPLMDGGGEYEIYFDTREREIGPAGYGTDLLPPVNLLQNPGFEEEELGLPAGWKVPPELSSISACSNTTGRRSLKLVVDGNTPEGAGGEAILSQMFDVSDYAGQEMVFRCDLVAERAAYGVPVLIELQQFREDGSRIREFAVEPRWLSLELAQGQLVQLCEQGRFHPEAARVNLEVRLRLYVRDADTGERITGSESYFTVWLDHFVVRPGERWEWPSRSNAGFVQGALEGAPLNRGFRFTGQRRLVFNGASEGTRTTNTFGDAPSVHWGLERGTLEFWCKPGWNTDDGTEHIFFEGIAIGHRLQSRLSKMDAAKGNQLEFVIYDSEGTQHRLLAPASLGAGRWHHMAAGWDFPRAELRLFVDGRQVGQVGPGPEPWPSSLVAVNEHIEGGMGIGSGDSRSMPMQAFIGGDETWQTGRSADAVIDEFRVSDILRYQGNFQPLQQEFRIDGNTRALFHFENERHGVHDSGDRYVQGHLACELEPQSQGAVMEVNRDGSLERLMVMVKPHASGELFTVNQAEHRMTVFRPFVDLPDPRFVAYRERQAERTVDGSDDSFIIQAGGDLDPWMRSVTFEHAPQAGPQTVLLPRWRSNNNVVPFSAESLAATLAPDAENDAEKAFEVFKYALKITNYYNGGYCETFPERHRSRISYGFIKALNIYPFEQCGPLNHRLRKLFLTTGISSTQSSGTHHEFEQAFHDGSLRLYDLSPRIYWLGRDNRTPVSRREMEDDPYLKLRQGGGANAWLPGRSSEAMFKEAERPHSMDFPMRPGERVSICWHNEGRWFELQGNREHLPLGRIPPFYGNGAIVYHPTREGESAETDNLLIRLSGNRRELTAEDPSEMASFIYRVHCPYIFSDCSVQGAFSGKRAGAVRMLLSFDRGKSWQEAWSSPGRSGEMSLNLLDEVTARYEYWLKILLPPGKQGRVSDLEVRSTFVIAPLTLPGTLSRGENFIRFTGGPPAEPVRTTCSWFERYRRVTGVELNSISYYMNSGQMHRNLMVVAPGEELPVKVGTGLHPDGLRPQSLQGEVMLQGLPPGWRSRRGSGNGEPGVSHFVLQPEGAVPGDIHSFSVMVPGGEDRDRVPVQVLVAEAPLVGEAEQTDEIHGNVLPVMHSASSGLQHMRFCGDGSLGFSLNVSKEATYALWFLARWEEGSSTAMELAVDGSEPRELSAAAMIGFTHWDNPGGAHTKMFAHYGEQYAHWSWYRIGEVMLTPGMHHLVISAKEGAHIDALLMLPQTGTMDRAAMNLFQNWNYAPWRNPL